MNIFQLVFKQMRQRALGTWLTLLSVMLGTALALAILVLARESNDFLGQRAFGYDSLIGKKGSRVQLVLNTIYHLDVSPGNIPFSIYGEMLKGGPYASEVKIAVPFVVGDTVNGKFPIMGTPCTLFGVADNKQQTPIPADQVLGYAQNFDGTEKYFELAQGHVFQFNKFEAVIGSDVARLGPYRLGDTFQATHTVGTANTPPEVHPQIWKVVGILKPTHTAADRTVYIPLMSFYTIAAHGAALIAQSRLENGQLPSTGSQFNASYDSVKIDRDGTEHHTDYILYPDKTFHLTIDPSVLLISGIMVQSRGGVALQRLQYFLNNGPDVMDVNPAGEMRALLDTFLRPSQVTLLIIASLVSIVAAIGILVSIYNSVSARIREIAILRALGATRRTILTLICLEASLIGLFGGLIGLVLAHAACAFASYLLNLYVGQGIDWLRVDWTEGVYLVAVVIVSALAGLVPAMKAYWTPVANNLVAV
ncbi:MAG TPA: ABC transporter permease [Tepidisphaeraceae bacterium]|nr:ABC transporter permease [Tepidisphaeraceae bacterium]